MVYNFHLNLLTIKIIFCLYEDNNTADAIKIILIPYLIPTKTIIKKTNATGGKNNWKPSLEESSKSFASFVSVSFDII